MSSESLHTFAKPLNNYTTYRNNYQECCLLTAISAPVYIRIRHRIHVDEEKNISLNSASKSYQSSYRSSISCFFTAVNLFCWLLTAQLVKQFSYYKIHCTGSTVHLGVFTYLSFKDWDQRHCRRKFDDSICSHSGNVPARLLFGRALSWEASKLFFLGGMHSSGFKSNHDSYLCSLMDL